MGQRRDVKEKLNQVEISSKRDKYRHTLRDTVKKPWKSFYLNSVDFDKAFENIDYRRCYELSEIRSSSEISTFSIRISAAA